MRQNMDTGQKIGVAIGISGIGLTIFVFAWQALGMTMPHLLLIGLIILAIAMIIGGWVFAFWNHLKLLFIGYTLRSPIAKKGWDKQSYSEGEEQAQLTSKQREHLDFYERQMANWKTNLRLEIKSISLTCLTSGVPSVTFSMRMISYLPKEIKLVKVAKSTGTVNVYGIGIHPLPAFPETIDKNIHACDETDFDLVMQVGATKVPDFLLPNLTPGQGLQWIINGDWYIEIDGKTEVWQSVGYGIMYNQVVAK